MPIRDLDPDNDYAYDKTNQSPRRLTLLQEIERRAKTCPRFVQDPRPLLYGVCKTCNGPRYAHTDDALRNGIYR